MRPSFDAIVAAVAAQAGLEPEAFFRRTSPGMSPSNYGRQRVLLLSRRLRPDLSWLWLARRLNRNSHGDLIKAVRVIEQRLERSPSEGAAIGELLAAFGLDHLPPYNPNAASGARLDIQIRAAERRLEKLRAERAELEPAL